MPARVYVVSLLYEIGKGRIVEREQVGSVKAASHAEAMSQAVERFGDALSAFHPVRARMLTVELDPRAPTTAWDRVLDDDLL